MTTNPHIKAGGLPPTDLHRVDASLLTDDRAVMVAGESKYADRPMPYTEIEEVDGPEEMIAALIVLVLCIAGLVAWRLA